MPLREPGGIAALAHPVAQAVAMALKDRARRLHAPHPALLREDRVAVQAEEVELARAKPRRQPVEVREVRLLRGGGARADARIRLGPADLRAGQGNQLRIARAVRLAGHPEVRDIRLVPDLVLRDAVPVVLCQCTGEARPRGDGLPAVVERHAAHARGVGQILHVERIAEAHVEPGLNAPREQTVHNPVQPAEVIDALFLLALRPAGLHARVLHAACPQHVIAAGGVEQLPVQALKADGNHRALDRLRRQGFHRSDAVHTLLPSSYDSQIHAGFRKFTSY